MSGLFGFVSKNSGEMTSWLPDGDVFLFLVAGAEAVRVSSSVSLVSWYFAGARVERRGRPAAMMEDDRRVRNDPP